MTELPAPQFRRTKSGTWAVMGPVTTLEAALAAKGGVVDVQKKSGDWSKFTVASLGRAFDVDGVQMCYGYPPDGGTDASQHRDPSTADRGSAARRLPPPAETDYGAEPPRDADEPLPEFRGGPEDEWQPEF